MFGVFGITYSSIEFTKDTFAEKDTHVNFSMARTAFQMAFVFAQMIFIFSNQSKLFGVGGIKQVIRWAQVFH